MGECFRPYPGPLGLLVQRLLQRIKEKLVPWPTYRELCSCSVCLDLPGTEQPLESAPCLPHGRLELVKGMEGKGMNTKVAVFATSPRLGSALAQVLVLLPAPGK